MESTPRAVGSSTLASKSTAQASSTLLEKNGAGLITPVGDDTALAAGVIAVLDDLATFRDGARTTAVRLRSTHSLDAVLQALDDLTRASRAP